MRILSIFALVHIVLRAFVILFTESIDDKFTRSLDCFRCNSSRVGSHICDKPDFFSSNFHTFIELLRNLHCKARFEVQSSVRILLQKRSCVRRLRTLLSIIFAVFNNFVFIFTAILFYLFCSFFIRNCERFGFSIFHDLL